MAKKIESDPTAEMRRYVQIATGVPPPFQGTDTVEGSAFWAGTVERIRIEYLRQLSERRASMTACTRCRSGSVPPGRLKIGMTTCLPCGEVAAKKVKHTIVPMAKSNYIVITDLSLLKGLNKNPNR